MNSKKFEIGTRVHCILYGGRDGIVYGIKGEQMPDAVRTLGGGCVVMGGNAYLDIVFEDGGTSNVPECIAVGVQWRILPGIASAQEIAAALANAKAKAAADKASASAAAVTRAELNERIKAENPHLIQGSDCVTAAKNIRTELKRAFPGVKFTVKTSRYSGGNSIDIAWTDGPVSPAVKAITDKYQECDFDGMTDCDEYRRGPWTGVFGGSRYVFENRHESPALIAAAIAKVCEEYGDKEKPAVEDFMNGQAYGTPLSNAQGEQHWNWQSLIRRQMAEMAA